MRRLLAARIAELFELHFPLHAFLVFAGVIVPVAADRTLEDDQIIGVFRFCHGAILTLDRRIGNRADFFRAREKLSAA